MIINSVNSAGTTGCPPKEEFKDNCISHLFKKISSKYTENLNLNPVVLKLLEGEKGKHFTHRHR